MVPDLEPQQRPAPDQDGPKSGPEALVGAWTQLRQQRSDFERRSEVLDALRQRLSKHLEKQNRVLLDRQRALDVRRLQNDRERVYLRDSRLHLQRCRQEENRTQERLQVRAREVEEQAEQIQRERSELCERLQKSQEEFKTRVDGLLQEKQAIAERLSDLQQQVADARRPAEPVPAGGRSRALPSWRLGIAVLAGFTAAGLLWTTSRFEYEVRVSLNGLSSSITPEALEWQRSELARALSVVDLPGKLSIAVLPESSGLDVSVLTADVGVTRPTLTEHIEQYLADLSQRRGSRLNEVRQELDNTQDELGVLQQQHEQIARRLADQRLAVEVETPREELNRLRTSLAEARDRHDQIAKAINESDTRLAALQTAAVPDAPQVDPAVLQAAETRDTQLHQDTEELRFHLNRLRKHLLETFVEFPQRIEKFTAAAQHFSSSLETRRFDVRDPAALERLDVMRRQTDRLTQTTVEFERSWRDLADRLGRMAVDPRAPHTQEIQRSVETLVDNLNHDCNEIVKSLQVEYQECLRTLDTRAEQFQLTTELKEGILRIQEAQYALMTLAGRVRTGSDIQLESIVHRVEGLARRVQDRRADIVEQLQNQQRQEMLQQLGESIATEETRSGDLDSRGQQAVDEILSLQDRLTALIPYLEEHGIASTVARYSQAEADQLSQQIGVLQERTQALGRERTELEGNPQDLLIQSVHVETWPANLAGRLGTIASGAIAVAVLMHLLVPAGLARRSQPVGKARG